MLMKMLGVSKQSLPYVSVLCAAIVSLGGCGGAAGEVRQYQFTEEHAAVFEDGVDFVADPQILSGRWLEDWHRDMQKRVELSDFVGVVTVTTFRTDTDPGQQTTHRLLATVDRRLHGDPLGDELTLLTYEGQEGYATVQENEQRILNQRFVVFVKWYNDEEGAVAAHWHLALASEPIVSRTEELIAQGLQERTDSKTQKRVIVHQNE